MDKKWIKTIFYFFLYMENMWKTIKLCIETVMSDPNELLFWTGFVIFCMTIVLILILIIAVVVKLLSKFG